MNLDEKIPEFLVTKNNLTVDVCLSWSWSWESSKNSISFFFDWRVKKISASSCKRDKRHYEHGKGMMGKRITLLASIFGGETHSVNVMWSTASTCDHCIPQVWSLHVRDVASFFFCYRPSREFFRSSMGSNWRCQQQVLITLKIDEAMNKIVKDDLVSILIRWEKVKARSVTARVSLTCQALSFFISFRGEGSKKASRFKRRFWSDFGLKFVLFEDEVVFSFLFFLPPTDRR